MTGTAVTDTPEATRTSWLRGLLARVATLGAAPDDSLETRARKTLLVIVSLIVLPPAALWGALYWIYNEPVAAAIPWSYGVVSLATLAVFARTRDLRLLRTVQLVLTLVLPNLLLVALGGVTPSGGVMLWSLLSPLGAIAVGRTRTAWRWFAAFAVLLVAGVLLAPVVRPDAATLPGWLVAAFATANIGVVSFVVFTLLLVFARQRETAQNRVESLLLNILPTEIAQRLQEDQRAIADHFDEATILFADVVDFTPLSTQYEPRELVALLDRLFSSFDELADRYGVEKIKTIGDCYMVAAGVPQRRADHAHALARMALEMHDCAAECLTPRDRSRLVLRIGLSSGPVVAGVIGRRRFLYDLWGDAVNMASRMESHGLPGHVQITRSTWELLRDDFVCEPRGRIDVKGKGPVETWTLVRPRT